MEYHITADTTIGDLMHEDSSDEFILSADVTLDELKHYGTKGMKWGVRRYQNRDGSLTKAGKKRRAKLEAELDKLKDPNEKPRPKTIAEMTDDELRSSINRMSLEKQYKEYDAILHPKQVKQVNKHVDTFKTRLVEGAAEGSKSLVRDFIAKKGAEVLGISEKKTKSALEKAQEKYQKAKYEHDYEELVNGKKKTSYEQLKEDWDSARMKKDMDEWLKGKKDRGLAELDAEEAAVAKRYENKLKIQANKKKLKEDYGIDVDEED